MTEKVCRNCEYWKKESQKGGECSALQEEHVLVWPGEDIHLWTTENFSCILFEEKARPFKAYFDEGVGRWRVGYRRILDDEGNLAPEYKYNEENLAPEYGKYNLDERTAATWAVWLDSIWREERDNDD